MVLQFNLPHIFVAKNNLPLLLGIAVSATVTVLTIIGLLSLQVISFQPSINDIKPPSVSTKCGIQECHGLDVTCGANVPDACTELYALGDRCRKYLSCVRDSSGCNLVKTLDFEKCRQCVEKC